jgi:hypothetical protein
LQQQEEGFRKFCLQGPLDIVQNTRKLFKIIYFTKWKGFFSSRLVTMSSSASHHGKANNYLNIKGENLDNYFWIVLVVS